MTKQDPDGDGFLNEDEWRAGTDPNDKISHAPYLTKLFFVRPTGAPFWLSFKAVDGDPKLDHNQSLTFQVNLRDKHEKTLFLKVGDLIEDTGCKVVGFEFKTAIQPKTGASQDVSELRVVNERSHEIVMLTLGKPPERVDAELQFHDELAPANEFTVRVMQEFALKSEPEVHYRLLAVKSDGALIELPDGSRQVVPPLPEWMAAKPKAP